MKVIGIDGNEHRFNFSHNSRIQSNPSKYHVLARELLKSLFPLDNIYEEVTLPGTKIGVKGKSLYADFFVPQQKLVVEVHGEQHYSFSSFFHKNKMEFYKAKNRDVIKKEFCIINSFSFVELPYTENEDEWKHRIECRE
jgi:hypothetical protein